MTTVVDRIHEEMGKVMKSSPYHNRLNLIILAPAEMRALKRHFEELQSQGFFVKWEAPCSPHIEFEGMRVISSPECAGIEFASQL